jgi:hypothetical protein
MVNSSSRKDRWVPYGARPLFSLVQLDFDPNTWPSRFLDLMPL